MAEIKTIGDLIDRLSQFPRDARVVTRGFDEAGYVDLSLFEKVRIFPDKHHCWDYYDDPQEKVGTFDAILLN